LAKAEASTKPECRAICIDPARVRDFWPHASPLIRHAIERGGLSRFADVERDVLMGTALLWLAWDGRAIAAAAVTQIAATDRGKVCVLVACGGLHMRRWLPLLGAIEAYARTEGCELVRIFGRKGWARVLPEYEARRVILEKAVSCDRALDRSVSR
jgi:hypothetical protein